jgi:hypothetical protein
LVQIIYVKLESFNGVWLSGIKYLQFLGKHLSVLGEEQSWSEVDTLEVESLNLQLKHSFRKEVAERPSPTIKLF